MKRLLILLSLSTTLNAGVFGEIEFGDDYRAVQQKLLASDLAETDLPATLMARTGINGIFKTTRKINDSSFELYFTFEDKVLTSMMLKSGVKPKLSSAMKLLEASARELDKIHGAAAQAGDNPEESAFPQGASSLFRVWHPKEGGSILLGLERNDEGFAVIMTLQGKFIELQKVPRN